MTSSPSFCREDWCLAMELVFSWKSPVNPSRVHKMSSTLLSCLVRELHVTILTALTMSTLHSERIDEGQNSWRLQPIVVALVLNTISLLDCVASKRDRYLIILMCTPSPESISSSSLISLLPGSKM